MTSPQSICMRSYSTEIATAGFAQIPEAVSAEVVETIVDDLNQHLAGRTSRRGEVFAARNLLSSVAAVSRLAVSQEIRSLVEPVMGSDSIAVRGILFDKVPGANWRVGWHQDQIIPVAERREVPGFTAWSLKEGMPHVRPPAAILECMLTLRLHLDDCDADNGALEVVPGSHTHGLLNDREIRDMVSRHGTVVCAARRGDVLAMRPLLLHASTPAKSPHHRRVVHLEFAGDTLPGGLQWPQ